MWCVCEPLSIISFEWPTITELQLWYLISVGDRFQTGQFFVHGRRCDVHVGFCDISVKKKRLVAHNHSTSGGRWIWSACSPDVLSTRVGFHKGLFEFCTHGERNTCIMCVYIFMYFDIIVTLWQETENCSNNIFTLIESGSRLFRVTRQNVSIRILRPSEKIKKVSYESALLFLTLIC